MVLNEVCRSDFGEVLYFWCGKFGK